jgi:DNA repair exonuclease SbcCD nuclease subunit
MKIACFGDRHVSLRSPRFEHALEVWDAAITDAIEQGASVFVGLGDVCEGDPNGEERMALGMRYKRMAERGSVFEVTGNHESRDALRWLEFLGVVVAWDEFVTVPLRGATLLLAPYARRGHAPYVGAETHKDSAQLLAETIAETVSGTREPVIVAGHWTPEGARLNDSDYEVHVGHEMVVPLAALAPASLVVTGHIHRRQAIGDNVVIAGSLYRCSFAEAAERKSYVLITVGDGFAPSWEHRPLPAREMVVRKLTWPITAPMDTYLEALVESVGGDRPEVKVTVEIPEDQVATFEPSVFDGIRDRASHFVLEKIVVPTERTRTPAIAQSTRLEDQLAAWAEATEQDLTPARAERVQAKVAEVQG